MEEVVNFLDIFVYCTFIVETIFKSRYNYSTEHINSDLISVYLLYFRTEVPEILSNKDKTQKCRTRTQCFMSPFINFRALVTSCKRFLIVQFLKIEFSFQMEFGHNFFFHHYWGILFPIVRKIISIISGFIFLKFKSMFLFLKTLLDFFGRLS